MAHMLWQWGFYIYAITCNNHACMSDRWDGPLASWDVYCTYDLGRYGSTWWLALNPRRCWRTHSISIVWLRHGDRRWWWALAARSWWVFCRFLPPWQLGLATGLWLLYKESSFGRARDTCEVVKKDCWLLVWCLLCPSRLGRINFLSSFCRSLNSMEFTWMVLPKGWTIQDHMDVTNPILNGTWSERLEV